MHKEKLGRGFSCYKKVTLQNSNSFKSFWFIALFFQMYYVPISIFPLPLGLPFCHVNILYGKPQFGRVCLFVFTYFCFYSLGWIISINLSSNLLILLSVSSNLILSLSEYFISAILFFWSVESIKYIMF